MPTFALALAASSSRLVHFWWDWQPHEPTHAALGSLTSFAVPGEGSTMTDVAIGVLDVTEVGQAMDDDRVAYEAPTPPRATWWRITLQVEGELPQDAACTLALADEQGHVVRYAPTSYPAADGYATLPVPGCRPSPIFAEDGTQEPIPQSYEIRRYLLTSGDFLPAEARLWWATPTYLSVPLTTPSS
ncbi:MAG: hypothetical protein KBB39_01375 [Phycicoccus sp.]|nr:hypothetical protein [Phycicoccus sp.]